MRPVRFLEALSSGLNDVPAWKVLVWRLYVSDFFWLVANVPLFHAGSRRT